LGWSVKKSLVRTGLPATGMLLASLVIDLYRRDPGVSWLETVTTDVGFFAFLWLCLAPVVWGLSRILPAR
jgi:hypothetical protein